MLHDSALTFHFIRIVMHYSLSRSFFLLLVVSTVALFGCGAGSAEYEFPEATEK